MSSTTTNDHLRIPPQAVQTLRELREETDRLRKQVKRLKAQLKELELRLGIA